MKKILILGAGIYQVPLIETAKKLGYYTIVASIPGKYPGFALADKVYHVNTTDAQALEKIAEEEGVSGVCVSGTDVCVPAQGYLCDKLGLIGPGEQAAHRAQDKLLMKNAFHEHGVRGGGFLRQPGHHKGQRPGGHCLRLAGGAGQYPV